MNDLTLTDGRTAFAPGEDLTGTITWSGEPAWLEVRLFWYTEGKGTQDVGVALTERLTDPGPRGERPFRMRAPDHPPSCSGRLVSIRWALELVSADDQPVVKVDVVIAPGAREIVLGHVG
jgi:hypothetical protein